MASMVRDTGMVFASRLARIVLGLATQSMLAWMLGVELRGSYAVCIIFAAMLGLVFQLGIDVASVYFVASKRFTLSEGMTYILICGGVGGLLAAVVGYFSIQMPLAFFDKASVLSFRLAMLHTVVLFFAVPIPNLLIAIHEFSWSAILSIAASVVNLLLVGGLLLVFPRSVNAALVGTVATGLFSVFFAVTFLRCKYKIRLVRPKLSPLLAMISYGLRYYIGKLSNQINFRVGTVILAFFATESEIGLFSVALLLVTQAEMIPNTLSTVLMPRVAADDKGQHKLVAQCARVSGVICTVLLAGLCILATPFIGIVFSPEFLPMVPLVRIMAIGVLFRSVSKLFVPYLIGMNHPGTASLAVGAGMVTNLTMLWILMPRLGLGGAAMAMTFNYLVSSAILTWAFVSISKMNLQSIFRFRWSDWAPLRRLRMSIFSRQANKS
jgi:O-antigen/teichoic acid export membrane protein